MYRSQGTTRGPCSKANACAVKTHDQVARWLYCLAAIIVCQVAHAQQASGPSTFAPLAMPQPFDSGNSNGRLSGISSGQSQPSVLQFKTASAPAFEVTESDGKAKDSNAKVNGGEQTSRPSGWSLLRQQAAVPGASKAAQPPAYVRTTRPPTYARAPVEANAATIDGSIPEKPADGSISQFLSQAYQPPAETDSSRRELPGPPTGRAIWTQSMPPKPRPEAPAVSKRTWTQSAYDSPLNQMGVPKPADLPSPSVGLTQPALVAEQSPLATAKPKSAERSADGTPKTSSTNSDFAGLWGQLSGIKRAQSDGGTMGSKADDGRKPRPAAAPRNNVVQAAAWSDSNQTAPTKTQQSGGFWSGLTRPFNMKSNEAPIRRPNVRQTANAAVSSDKTESEVPESERVPTLLLPFYQTNDTRRNGRTGARSWSRSRAHRAEVDIDQTIIVAE